MSRARILAKAASAAHDLRTALAELASDGEPMPPCDLLSALLNLVHDAARGDSKRAHRPSDATATRLAPPLVDMRVTAFAPSDRTTAVDPPRRQARTSYLHVGDIPRFDADTARAAVGPTGSRPGNATRADPHSDAPANASSVRRLSRKGRLRAACAGRVRERRRDGRRFDAGRR